MTEDEKKFIFPYLNKFSKAATEFDRDLDDVRIDFIDGKLTAAQAVSKVKELFKNLDDHRVSFMATFNFQAILDEGTIGKDRDRDM